MQKFFKVLIHILFTISALPVFSQVDSVALAEEYYKMGMEVYDFEHRKQATELFVMATQMNPGNAKAQFMAGKSIMLTVQKEESLPYFMRAWILDQDVDEEIIYYIGQAYQYSQKFDSAILFYEHYNKLLSRSMKFQKSLKINEVNHKIFECRNAKIYEFYPVDVTITNLGLNVNSEWADYAPAISADESVMVFTSRRPDENVNPDLAEDLEYYEDIYISYRKNSEWQPARNIGTQINTRYHNASINLSPDGRKLFLYMDNNGGDVYESTMQDDSTWSFPQAMRGEVNTEYLENSAAITADEQKMYFSSTRPGGYGGSDLYVATKNKNGAWINPINLGPVINTELDEEGVFVSSSGKDIYFSSNGHAGMGDLDIYRSSLNAKTNEWEEPLNLGYPINSVENDIFFVLTGDEKYAYYSSLVKPNKGEQDIYKIDMQNWKPVDLSQPVFVKAWMEKEEEELKAPAPPSLKLEITVVDEISLEPIEAKVVLISENDHLLTPEAIGTGTYVYAFELTSDIHTKYTVRITREGYLPHISEFQAVNVESGRSKIRQTIVLNKARKFYAAVLNVYFGLDKDKPNSFEDIQYIELLMRETPSLKVEIAGYTDNAGSEEYNLDLSRRRAEAVRKYLIDAGISADRISSNGYGESNPVADNATRAGRRLNRRTEFRIIEE